MDFLLRRILRLATARGLAGENVAWLGIALAAYLLRRSRRPVEPVVASMPIRPGDRILVSMGGRRDAGTGAGTGTPPSSDR